MLGEQVQSWLSSMVELLQPEKVEWIHGGEAEHKQVLQTLVEQGVAIPLNPKLRPDSYLFRSDPRDVARVESRTFICSETAVEAGPTNNWMAPDEMIKKLMPLFRGVMKGRTLYVIPFAMGPLSSPFAKCGIQLSDSLYVVANMALMTHVGDAVLRKIEESSLSPLFTRWARLEVKRCGLVNLKIWSWLISLKRGKFGLMEVVMVAMLCSAKNVWRFELHQF